LFHWSPTQAHRVEEILLENVTFPQTFVRAWALDGLATLAEGRPTLMPIVRRHLRDFAQSPSKALQARAKQIRVRLSRRGGSGTKRSFRARRVAASGNAKKVV
jgi:hypothetical protein